MSESSDQPSIEPEEETSSHENPPGGSNPDEPPAEPKNWDFHFWKLGFRNSLSEGADLPMNTAHKSWPIIPLIVLVSVGVVFLASIGGNAHAQAIAHDFPLYLKGQIWVFGQLALYSLLPAIAGMVYRRAFGKWFALSFLILAVLQLWLVKNFQIELVSGDARAAAWETWTEKLFLTLESFLVVTLVLFRVRRYYSSVSQYQTREYFPFWLTMIPGWLNKGVIEETRKFFEFSPRRRLALYCIGGTTLALAGHLLYFWVFGSRPIPWSSLGFIVSLEVILLGIVASFASCLKSENVLDEEGKNIVICVDGTWNQPGQQDYGYLAETNVYKLFKMLEGKQDKGNFDASQTKIYHESDRHPDRGKPSATQIAFYYNGVGNRIENSQLGQLFGGAFGMGASSIVHRAYLDLVRVYEPGDRIYIYGFSRGAAIARLIAGVISRRGIPQSVLTLRLLGRHWILKASRKKWGNVPIAVLGCWDTVGSFGLAKNLFGIPFQKINLLKDLTVADTVKRAYHMVALDETRDAFVPTLMNPDPTTPERIIEVWFPGNHSNVGGGYATDKLSNIALDFLLRKVTSGYAAKPGMLPGNPAWGMYLSAAHYKAFVGERPETTEDRNDPPETQWRKHRRLEKVVPNPLGQIRQADGAIYKHKPRELPDYAVIHDSVVERMCHGMPMYAPESVFELNRRVMEKRLAIGDDVEKLVATSSISEEAAEQVRTWSKERLRLVNWSDYLKSHVLTADGFGDLGDFIDPEKELGPEADFRPELDEGEEGFGMRAVKRLSASRRKPKPSPEQETEETASPGT